MRNKKQLAAFMAAVLAANTTAMVSFAGEKNYSIDLTSENDSAWDSVAMANDDTVQSGVNIRSAASEEASVLGYLYRGGAVTVLDKGDTWTEIQSGGITGYIKNEYLVYGTEAKGLAEYYGSYGVRASWDDVNVFSNNDAASSILRTANDGDTFLHISSDGHWIEVQNGADSTAYVSAEDVTNVIMVSSAVSVNADENAGAAEAASYGGASVSQTSADESYADTYYEDTSYTENYSDTSYDDTYYDSSETYYEDTTYSDSTYDDNTYEDTSYYSDSTYTDTGYEDTGASASTYTYTEVSTDGMSLAEKAQTLYQVYLEAQAAADAAVTNGADEQTIIDTCAAAQSAYATYVKAQNAADEASWGYSSGDTSATTTTTTTTSDSTDTTAYVQPETQAPETEAVETEAAETESSSTVSSSDVELLAALIYCEAGNQPYEGQVAVGAVVMNRVASGSFPNTISDVIYQGGQFTPAYSGALSSAMASGAGSSYIAAASAAMAGEDPTGGSLYFNTSHGSGVKIGAHWFY